MTTIKHDSAKIEAALALLEREHGKLIEWQQQHAYKKRALAFDAHGGDGESGKRLQALQREAADVQSRINSIVDAINEGQHRLALARAYEQKERDKAKAEALRPALSKFVAAGRELDQAMAQLVRASGEAQTALRDLHLGGISHPRKESIDVLCYRAICTGLRQTIWAGRFEPINPNDRKTFGALFDAWGGQIANVLAALAGEQIDEAA